MSDVPYTKDFHEYWKEEARHTEKQSEWLKVNPLVIMSMLNEIERLQGIEVPKYFNSIPVIVTEWMPDNTILISADLAQRAGLPQWKDWKRKVGVITNLFTLKPIEGEDNHG